MRRALKDTGSIYVHCDWHASHYIKCEMDKIFGYENFVNEIIWSYRTGGTSKKTFSKKHDIILFYSKSDKYFFKAQYEKTYIPTLANRTFAKEELGAVVDEEGCLVCGLKGQWCKQSLSRDVWEVQPLFRNSRERIGYPTQKPGALVERIIIASTKEGDVVADFFMGGGTTCAVAQKLNRKFIGCDISRVASSVTLNRLIKDAEEISGRTASVNIENPKKDKQTSLELTIKQLPDIHVYYMGVYPIEKFEFIGQKEFEDFILTCYEARRFTGEGEITGVMNASTSILIGSVKPHESLSEERLKKFTEDVLRLRYQENMRLKLKVIAWVFPPSLQKYSRVLESYFYKKNLAIDIEMIPINSQLFRKRILEHYQDTAKSEFLLKFISQPSIMDISYKKAEGLKYKFEAIGARSNNIDGYLINCQWDFNFVSGRFGESEHALMREQKDKKYTAVLKAEKEFEKPGKYIVVCRVQDNLGGEAIKTKEVEIK